MPYSHDWLLRRHLLCLNAIVESSETLIKRANPTAMQRMIGKPGFDTVLDKQFAKDSNSSRGVVLQATELKTTWHRITSPWIGRPHAG